MNWIVVICSVAWAQRAPSDPYEHPLQDPTVQAMYANGQLDPQFPLRSLHVYDSIEVTASGLEILVSTAELRDISGTPVVGPPEPATTTMIHPDVQAWMADPSGSPQTVDVALSVSRASWVEMPVLHLLEEELLTGTIDDEGDADSFVLGELAARFSAGETELSTLRDRVIALGGQVQSTAPLAGTLIARVPRTSLSSLSVTPGLVHFEPHEPPTVDDDGLWTSFTNPMDGLQAEDSLQSVMFYSNGWHGNGEETIAVVETNAHQMRRRHPGYRFGPPPSAFRVTNCDGTGNSCTNNTNFDPGERHAMGVMSVAIGDLTLGQDPSISCATNQCRERSGIARRNQGLGISPSDWDHVHHVLTDPRRDIHVSNHSYSYARRLDPTCHGLGTQAQNANALFENGVAFIKSAGNGGVNANDPDDCRVGVPGAAMGVFPVAAYRADSNGDGEILPGSAQGGTSGEGNGRKIIGMAAPTRWKYPYSADSTNCDYGTNWATPSNGLCDKFLSRTSAASPVIAGVSGLFRDWFTDRLRSRLIDHPGMLYANLLLFGDRFDGTSNHDQFDDRWGAGRVRMRLWSKQGADAPSKYQTGHVCVDNGQTISLYPNGYTTLSSDVDRFRAVAWWYDPGRDEGSNRGFDKIDLRLDTGVFVVDPTPTVEWSENASWSTTNDNRQRVTYAYPSDEILRLRLIGRDVTDDKTGCGTDSMRVYYAFYYEDTDRDDDTDLANWVRVD